MKLFGQHGMPRSCFCLREAIDTILRAQSTKLLQTQYWGHQLAWGTPEYLVMSWLEQTALSELCRPWKWQANSHKTQPAQGELKPICSCHNDKWCIKCSKHNVTHCSTAEITRQQYNCGGAHNACNSRLPRMQHTPYPSACMP